MVVVFSPGLFQNICPFWVCSKPLILHFLMSRKYCQNIFWSAPWSAPSPLSVSRVQKSTVARCKLRTFHTWGAQSTGLGTTWTKQSNWSGRERQKRVLLELNINWFLTWLLLIYTVIFLSLLYFSRREQKSIPWNRLTCLRVFLLLKLSCFTLFT